MTEPKLLPCPFCGSEEIVFSGEFEGTLWILYCATCESEGSARDTRAEAIAAWNRRTPAVSREELDELLEDIRDREVSRMERDYEPSAMIGWFNRIIDEISDALPQESNASLITAIHEWRDRALALTDNDIFEVGWFREWVESLQQESKP